MSDLNCISLTGRAGRDTELRHLESGSKVATVTIAVNKRPSRSEPKPDPEWFEVNFWGNTADVAAQFVKKGSQIAVTGRVSLERWTDRTTGEERVKLAVNADSLTLLGGKPQDPNAQAGPGGNGGGQHPSSQAAPQRQPAQRRAATPAAHAAPAGRAPAAAAYTEEIPF